VEGAVREGVPRTHLIGSRKKPNLNKKNDPVMRLPGKKSQPGGGTAAVRRSGKSGKIALVGRRRRPSTRRVPEKKAVRGT